MRQLSWQRTYRVDPVLSFLIVDFFKKLMVALYTTPILLQLNY
jgi:hypothetical protein